MRGNIFILVLILLCGGSIASAQKEYNIWPIANEKKSIDFNGSTPVIIKVGNLDAREGNAAICDRNTGELLFYTNGETIWNRNHSIMRNGNYLNGHQSSTQSALIVPMPGDSFSYYVFTSDANENRYANGINYSIVDMRYENGLGEVRVKNIQLLHPASEKLCAVRHCNGRDFWVIVHTVDFAGAGFYAYPVTDSGVGTPVTSNVGGFVSSLAAPGYLKASPNGDMLAMVRQWSNVDLLRFDDATGVVSDPIVLQTTGLMNAWGLSPYGVSFSPDNTKLYTSFRSTGALLMQYDVSVYNVAAIIASQLQVYVDSSGRGWGAMQIGPDRRLYLPAYETGQIAVIEYPDRRGTACEYRSTGFVSAGPLGLPNLIDGYIEGERKQPKAVADGDTAICRGDSVQLHGSGGPPYHWYPVGGLSCTDCPEPFARPSQTTTYYLDLGGCNSVTDSVVVTVLQPPSADAGSTRIICAGDSIRLHSTGGSDYHWSPANGLSCTNCAEPVAKPTVTTLYTVMVGASNGCTATDTVSVIVVDLPSVDAGPSQAVCHGDSVKLTASTAGAAVWQWAPSTGLSCDDCESPVASPSATTLYTLQASNAAGCTVIDTVSVTVFDVPAIDAGADVTICTGDSTWLKATGAVNCHWSPTVGLSCVDCASPVARPLVTTLYRVTAVGANGCSASDSVLVTVIGAGSVDAGPSQTICAGDSMQLQASDGTAWQWSPPTGLSCTDCRSPIAHPSATTLYTVTVSAAGCSASDTVTVAILDVPVISTGPDVSICSGSRAQLHASGGVSYQWSPAEGLSCTDCADPIASPKATTVYHVTGRGVQGCQATDTLRVEVGSQQTLRGHIGRDYRLFPGTPLRVPVVLDEAITAPGIDTMEIALSYGVNILRLNGVDLSGGILNGWKLEPLNVALGNYRARVIAPVGVQVQGSGTLLTLEMAAFLGDSLASELPMTVELVGTECQRVEISTGRVALDSVCGMTLRLVRISADKYSLSQNDPNPFNPSTRIAFSLAFDGPARLEIFDAVGTRVAVLIEEAMAAGSYEAVWDASNVASGVYYYRLTSGTWSATRRMVVVK
jgi:hypothetical protein